MAKVDDAELVALAIGTTVMGFAGLMAVVAGVMNLILLDLEGIWMLLLGLVFWSWGWFLVAPSLKDILKED